MIWRKNIGGATKEVHQITVAAMAIWYPLLLHPLYIDEDNVRYIEEDDVSYIEEDNVR